jgi:hypothetical protein
MKHYNPISSPNNTLVDQLQEIEKVVITRNLLRERVKERIMFSNPILERDNNGIIYRCTINVIQGKAGAHKSRLMELFCSCILSTRPSDDFVGFHKSKYNTLFTLLYVDTERNTKDQLPIALQKIIRKAGYFTENQPDNFDYISMIEVNRENRLEVLKQYIERIRENNEGHIVIVLDVITDLISNFNDPRESMKLIDYMNSLINSQNVTFLCIVHENPSAGDKARGHLGTEIMNKASLQMQIAFEKTKKNEDTDLIRVKYLKTRVGKRPEPFHLVYSEVKKSLVIAGNNFISDVTQSKKHSADIADVKVQLLEKLMEPKHRADLVDELIAYFGCSKNTILERLNHLHVNQVSIISKEGIDYTLKKRKDGRIIEYYLSSIDSELNLKDD